MKPACDGKISYTSPGFNVTSMSLGVRWGGFIHGSEGRYSIEFPLNHLTHAQWSDELNIFDDYESCWHAHSKFGDIHECCGQRGRQSIRAARVTADGLFASCLVALFTPVPLLTQALQGRRELSLQHDGSMTHLATALTLHHAPLQSRQHSGTTTSG